MAEPPVDEANAHLSAVARRVGYPDRLLAALDTRVSDRAPDPSGTLQSRPTDVPATMHTAANRHPLIEDHTGTNQARVEHPKIAADTRRPNTVGDRVTSYPSPPLGRHSAPVTE